MNTFFAIGPSVVGRGQATAHAEGTGGNGHHRMNPDRQFLSLLCTVVVAAWLGCGCAHRSASASSRQLFREIQIGMPRSQVEVILGAPGIPQTSPGEEAWYLPPPRIGFSESPYAPGTIGIRFTREGKVASKRLNPQYRD